MKHALESFKTATGVQHHTYKNVGCGHLQLWERIMVRGARVPPLPCVETIRGVMKIKIGVTLVVLELCKCIH